MRYGNSDNFDHSGDTMECAEREIELLELARAEGRMTHPEPVATPVAIVEPVASKPVILIEKGERGSYDFAPPFKNRAFIEDFKTKVGKPFRCWNTFKNCWQVKPLDPGMLDYIADILRAHFKTHDVAIQR